MELCLQKIEESESEQETPASKQDKRAVDIIVYESCMDDENENNNIQEKMDLSAEWNRLCENEESDGDNISEDETEVIFKPGPLSKYMEIHEAVKIFEGPHTILDEIPKEMNDGMYFIIENRETIERRSNGKNSIFWDDCGAWKNAKSPVTYFLHRDGRLRTIVNYKIDQTKCFVGKIKSIKNVYTPL